VSADGKVLAAGSSFFRGAATLRLISPQPRTIIAQATDHAPLVAAFSPDGLALVVGEADCGIFLCCRK
jgi:hypothetical protein